MNMRTIIAAAALAVGAIGLAAPANAQSYSFSLTFGDQSGAGKLTTASDASAGPSLVTSIDGTLDGQAITLLPPSSYAGNDNLLSAFSPFFSVGGLSFTAGNQTYNLYNAFGTPVGCTPSIPGCDVPVTFSLNAATPAVPEPATWLLMLSGFGAIGFSMRRRRQGALLRQVA